LRGLAALWMGALRKESEHSIQTWYPCAAHVFLKATVGACQYKPASVVRIGGTL
jgi:hypothetical protein